MLALRTFGRLALEHDGSHLRDFDTQRLGLAILAVLAAEGSMSRDRLMALLWPESDAAHARGSLKQALYQLRRSLNAPDLFRGSVMLSLNSDRITSDVGRFRLAMLRRDFAHAAAEYAGPFLEAAHLVPTSEFEDWVAGVRSEVARQWEEAVERLAATAEAGGDTPAAVHLWRQLQSQDPADARRTLRLMRALDADGRPAGALEVALAHERLVQREWGLPPHPEVGALAAALRARAPTAAGGAVAVPMQTPGSLPRTPGPADSQVAASGSGDRPRATSRRLLQALVALVALAVLTAVALVQRARPGSGTPGDSALVAVAPFQVMDSSLVLWGEGMAEILTRDLDGAGPLRTVALGQVLQQWEGTADLAGAAALGERTGAGLVVFGSALRLDRDSVALRASVLDRGQGHVVAEVQARGPEATIGRLADSLVVGLLAIVGRELPIGAARRVSLAARSLPALREFLRGEQYFRRGQWDSSLVYYDRAIARDPGFGLAYRRMYQALSWGPANATRYGHPQEARRMSWTLNDGLAPRDSLLIRADSLRAAAESLDDPSLQLGLGREAREVLEDVLLRYPDDVEAWYELGELVYHDPPPVGGSAIRALAAFERAIALDAGFAPAYEHAIELSWLVHGQAVAARYARSAAGLTRGPAGSTVERVALALDPEAGEGNYLALSVQSGNGLLRTSDLFRWGTDSTELAIRTLRLLDGPGVERRGGGLLVTDSLLRNRMLARALAFRGHLGEAARVWRHPARSAKGPKLQARFDPFLELALFGAVADSVAERLFGAALDPATDWGRISGRASPIELTGAPWWHARGDTLALARLSTRAAAVARAAASPVTRYRGMYVRDAARAYLTLLRGDSTAAVELLASVPDSLCLVQDCFHEKVTLARLLAARGELRPAMQLLDDWVSPFHNTPSAVLALYDRARIAEQVGDVAGARSGYRFVAEAWARSDAHPRQVSASAQARHRQLDRGT